MKGLFGTSALVASLFTRGTNGDATATFGDGSNGISGTVDVTDGGLSISLDISELMAMNYSGVPDGEECFTGGLKYHIHEFWTYDDNNDRVESDCGSTYTGGHWDPWLGCGSATGNDYCEAQDGCVAGSSAYGDGDGGYQCSTTTFGENAYACEVGDWNGKYGLAMVDDSGMISISGSSPFEVSGDDIADMSVVFHCNGGDRAFCAPFVTNDDSDGERPTQADEDNPMMYGADFYDEIGNETGSIVLYPTGDFMVSVDVSDYLCSDYAIRIYNDWDSEDMSALGSDCDDIVGDFYDPTVSCAYGSDSEYCLGDDMTICNSSDAYSCDYENNRFSCAPGDITGKFSCDTSEGMCEIMDSDDLMIDLSLLDGKSFVIQCMDDYSIQACAAIQSDEYTTDGDDDDDDDDAGDDDDDDADDDDDSDTCTNCVCGTATLSEDNSMSIELKLDIDSSMAYITIYGPAEDWYGVGFGSSTMENTYAIITLGDDTVNEYKLASSSTVLDDGNTLLATTLTTVSTTTADSVRTASYSRSFAGSDSDYYTFDGSSTSIDLIWGTTADSATFTIHSAAGIGSISLSSDNCDDTMADDDDAGDDDDDDSAYSAYSNRYALFVAASIATLMALRF